MVCVYKGPRAWSLLFTENVLDSGLAILVEGNSSQELSGALNILGERHVIYTQNRTDSGVFNLASIFF